MKVNQTSYIDHDSKPVPLIDRNKQAIKVGLFNNRKVKIASAIITGIAATAYYFSSKSNFFRTDVVQTYGPNNSECLPSMEISELKRCLDSLDEKGVWKYARKNVKPYELSYIDPNEIRKAELLECIGKEDQICNAFKDEIQKLLKEDLYTVSLMVRKNCIGKTDATCQSLVAQTFTLLSQEPVHSVNFGRVSMFAKDCIGKTDKACQSILKAAFSLLLEKKDSLSAKNLAKQCIEKEDATCHSIVLNAFSTFVKKELWWDAKTFAEACLGKRDKACQSVVGAAYPALHAFSPLMAESFGKACIASGQCVGKS